MVLCSGRGAGIKYCVPEFPVPEFPDGFDPFAGIMHHSRPLFPAYAYDLIEPERPKIDAAILAFAQSRKFSGADFILRKDGVCLLSPQLARLVTAKSIQFFANDKLK